MSATIQGLIADMRGVATLPQVYFTITQVLNDPHASSTALARIVAEDPGLTSRLLRLVNSPLFGSTKRIATVPEAILMVGTTQLEDLALATSVLELFHAVPPEFCTMESFWRHSVACGVGARIIATKLRQPNVERFFVAGLLHDIGRPVLYLRAPELARRVFQHRESHGGSLRDAELAILGFDHGQLGEALLESWRIPSGVTIAVRHHHEPTLRARASMEAAAVHVADHFAHALAHGTSGERVVPRLDAGAWMTLGLPTGVVPEILAELDHQFQGVVEAMLRGEPAEVG